MSRHATMLDRQRLKAPASITDTAARALGSTLFGHLCCGRLRIFLDMSGVNEIDAAGVDMLIQAAKRAHGMGGDLVLVRPCPLVRNVLGLEYMTRGRQRVTSF